MRMFKLVLGAAVALSLAASLGACGRKDLDGPPPPKSAAFL